MQKFSDPILKACPTCKKKVQKLFSAPAIQFKGTGWYVTDYSGKSSGGKDRDAKSSEPKGSGDSDKSSKSGKDTSEKKPSSGTKKSSDSSKE
jgi:predicted nucleic acid-binding Zn ribbon protein